MQSCYTGNSLCFNTSLGIIELAPAITLAEFHGEVEWSNPHPLQ